LAGAERGEKFGLRLRVVVGVGKVGGMGLLNPDETAADIAEAVQWSKSKISPAISGFLDAQSESAISL
jgi:DNA-binding transcriptional regulator GbsR (MarR family)